MQQKQNFDKRQNLEKLRRRMISDMNLHFHSYDSRTHISDKFSQDSLFSFQDYYSLDEKLGQGVEGVVRKCHQIQSSKCFAVKILWVQEQKIFLIKKNFLASRILKHPSIIKHHKLYINKRKQQAFLVMEYCSYPSLQSQYKSINSRKQVSNIMKSLLQAVFFLHKKGICHRDLKLQNILYDNASGNIKIIDLGISKVLFNQKSGQKSNMWSVTGTLHYKAPEMLQGCDYDEKIDTWALGIVAYQLAYHKFPFSSEFQISLIQKILKQQPSFQQTRTDNLLINFIKRLLQKDPKKRMNCFEALHHPFIKNSLPNTKQLRYSLSKINKFNSKIYSSKSLDRFQSDDENPILRKNIIQQLKQPLIRECYGSFL